MSARGLVLALALGASACMRSYVKTERRPDGIYHLTCKVALQDCLHEAETLCGNTRYVVLRAYDLNNHQGTTDRPTYERTSEAFLRCGEGPAWGDENKELLASELCPAPPERVVPTATVSRCTPGASAACTGPGGCAGGQTCGPDGASFGPCDCGAKAAPAP